MEGERGIWRSTLSNEIIGCHAVKTEHMLYARDLTKRLGEERHMIPSVETDSKFARGIRAIEASLATQTDSRGSGCRPRRNARRRVRDEESEGCHG